MGFAEFEQKETKETKVEETVVHGDYERRGGTSLMGSAGEI